METKQTLAQLRELELEIPRQHARMVMEARLERAENAKAMEADYEETGAHACHVFGRDQFVY